MRLPLHIKTTLLTSVAIVVIVFAAALIFSSVVLNSVHDDQKEYTEAQAENLAEKIAAYTYRNDSERLISIIQIFDSARVNKDSTKGIRYWEAIGPVFAKRIETGNSRLSEDLSEQMTAALLTRREIKAEDASLGTYRVIVPVITSGRVVGAVEFTEELDGLSDIFGRYWKPGLVLIILFVLISTLTIYFLTNSFVYRPLEKIVAAMQRVEKGDLTARVSVTGEDEFGVLGKELNSMLDNVEDLTKERQRQKEILEVRVLDATRELRLRNDELEDANLEIWKAANKLSEFEKLAAAGRTAAQFAHEVGTPLNLISGHVQLLLKDSTGSDQNQERLKLIGSQIDRIEGIVRRMLDNTRISESVLEKLDINSVVSDIIRITEPKFKTAGIEVEHSGELSQCIVNGDKDRLQQVFLNLLNNSADAMPSGGKITINVGQPDNAVSVRVSDTGTGMDDETRRRIFEPLFSTKKKGEGTGLGLVVVKQIVAEHGASIDVESVPGAGTSFLLTFPPVVSDADTSTAANR